MTGVNDLTRDYRAAFLRYLPRREEAPLAPRYEIGRAAFIDGLSMLELARASAEPSSRVECNGHSGRST